MANQKAITTPTATATATPEKDRAESIRIVNIKAVSEKLSLSEQRIRNLVHDGKLATEQRTLEGTDISFTIVPDNAIQTYLDNVANNVEGYSSRKRSVNHIAYIVYIPKDADGNADPAMLAVLTAANLSFKVRSATKDSDSDSDDSATEPATANATTSATVDAATLEANRNASVNASIPS